MDPKLTEVSQLFERFKAAFVRNDIDTCTSLLSQLKVLLTGFKSLPPLFEDSSNAVHELTIARDIYEHAVVLSVKTEDQDAFERDFFQLKPYYTDTGGRLPPSPQEYPILGLNLLRLLVQNRIAEFHTELELLSPAALENPCIRHAVELEQSFMEGAYNRVLSARQTVPHETYVYFMDLLAKTVRDEIGGCSEKAYDYLSISDAKQMLMFSSDHELLEYIKEEHPEWEIKNGFVFFQKAKESAPCKEIPSLQLINQTLMQTVKEYETLAMAISLRRAFSARNFLFLRSSIHCGNLSYSRYLSSCNLVQENLVFGHREDCNVIGLDFLRESRRWFAKGRKSRNDDDDGDTVEVVPDIRPTVKAAAQSQMDAAIDAFSRDLSKLRSGRASAGMLDHIIVETGGVKMALSHLAVVSVLDSKTLSVTPYDPNTLKELEHAIVSSPLGLNPMVESQRLVAAIPPMTKENMQAMCKVVTKSAEEVKQSIRRARQKALDSIKKAGSSIPKDDAKRFEKEVDEMTKKFIKSAEDMCKAKEKEIVAG
ncbi:hypothetical protein NE237_023817 [Protea cynaroides]|uniref:PCI domain-containing protein n=1 Tax=Protea cynaroides TaxID=273540 RepID=A0A9Q0HFQ5_9MAGN|nr:hypothetical protein NE237_023817 [Protea cynaroides]